MYSNILTTSQWYEVCDTTKIHSLGKDNRILEHENKIFIFDNTNAYLNPNVIDLAEKKFPFVDIFKISYRDEYARHAHEKHTVISNDNLKNFNQFKIKILCLSYCKLNFGDHEKIFDLPTLEMLDLSNNLISTHHLMNGVISESKNLNYLDLSCNQIDIIGVTNIVGNSNLKYLDLTKNHIFHGWRSNYSFYDGNGANLLYGDHCIYINTLSLDKIEKNDLDERKLMEEFHRILSENKTIEYLNLSFNALYIEHTEFNKQPTHYSSFSHKNLIPMIEHFPNNQVKTLILKGNYLDDDNGSHLLLGNKTITSLNLSANCLTAKGVSHLLDFFEKQRNMVIADLILDHNPIGNEEMALVTGETQVKKLSMVNCKMKSSSVLGILKDNHSVLECDLSNNEIGSSGASGLLEKNNSVTDLNLSCNMIENGGAIKLLNKNISVKKLNLMSNRIKFEGASVMLKGNKTLTELNLSNNLIDDRKNFTLLKETNVEKLFLSTNQIGDLITSQLLDGNKTLTYLDLSNNNITADGVTNLLNKNKSVTELNLTKNKINKIGIAKLNRKLQSDKILKKLHLENQY